MTIDHARLLNKYIEHVVQCEGAYFITSINSDFASDVRFSDDEIEELKRLQQYPLTEIESEGEK